MIVWKIFVIQKWYKKTTLLLYSYVALSIKGPQQQLISQQVWLSASFSNRYWRANISGQMLSSHSIVSPSRTVRSCIPWGGRWTGHWRTTVWFVLLHHTHRPQRRPYPIGTSRRGNFRHRCGGGWAGPRLFFEGHSGGWVPVSEMKMRSLEGLSVHSANGRRRAFAHDGRVSAGWSRCPGSMARRVRGNVAPLRRSSAGLMAASVEKLSSGLGGKHPVTIRKVSLMAGSMRRVWALRHQTGAQYSAVECTRARVDIRRVLAPAPQPEPASCLRSTTRDVSFLRSDSRCQRYASDLTNVTPRYLGSQQKGRVSLLYLTLSSRLAPFLLRWKAADTAFVVLSFSFQVWRNSPMLSFSFPSLEEFTVCLISTPSIACQSPLSCMIARSSAYAYFLETVIGRSEM